MSHSMSQASILMSRWTGGLPIDWQPGPSPFNGKKQSSPIQVTPRRKSVTIVEDYDLAPRALAEFAEPEDVNNQSSINTEVWTRQSRTARRQLTPTAGRAMMQTLQQNERTRRENVKTWRKMHRADSDDDDVDAPSLMPGEPPIYIGTKAHAKNVQLLKELDIRSVVNVAPVSCRDPISRYKSEGIDYFELEAHDDHHYQIIDECLQELTAFIDSAHDDMNQAGGVLVHCSRGVNRSASLVLGYLLMRDKPAFLTLFDQCVRIRPCIVQNPQFQLQLCTLAHTHGLLYDPFPEGLEVEHSMPQFH